MYQFYSNPRPNSKQWGWFEEEKPQSDSDSYPDLQSLNTLPTPSADSQQTPVMHNIHHPSSSLNMSVGTPDYVLSESTSSQRLWSQTASRRPVQPPPLRSQYEELWIENFKKSKVDYGIDYTLLFEKDNIDTDTGDTGVGVGREGGGLKGEYVGVTQDETELKAELELLQTRSRSRTTSNPNPNVQANADKNLRIIYQSPNTFGTTVSKTFLTESRRSISVNISIRSYRVVQSSHAKFAQYLVVYSQNSTRLGVWKRYSDFENLSRIVQGSDECNVFSPSPSVPKENLPNALCSWKLLKRRKSWFRCLDSSYLCLKVFLLERFLHDVLFESEDGNVLKDFVMGRI
ncbi:hypothetical protein TrVE_jg2403 [Triparma verrucosa]|uniref:PX domain-containing protein n=1 Tax=Triparma verrucosa TaxID=1606542 RepID=A0A9W7CK79_9STRA|nr:hypothetical protein TrVE_jg2403 [Triparma verrucosa]